MAYSHEEYMKHHASIRKAQKKYYKKNKKTIVKKYASVRRKWDKAHRKHLNEHARLNVQAKGNVRIDAGVLVQQPSSLFAGIKKAYLRDLHKRGLI